MNTWFYRGVVDITVHPSFPEEPYVYLFYTASREDPESAEPTVVRLSRFEVRGDVAATEANE